VSNDKKVVTRFAPSPTGYMHIGGVRTALFAWAFARKMGGTFILRFEDTDKEREVEGSKEHIIESLRWLGIEWDEGPDIGGPNAPYIQSQRLESYKKYGQMLVDKGCAYADPYTKEELDEFRKLSEMESKPFLYRNHRPENPPVWDGTQPLRLKVNNIRKMVWNDLVRGELSAGEEALDDIILIKSDGYPTYNFAHIIDDYEMGVTHIMRADEFISSTPKFLSIYEALGIERPEFATLPPIMAPEGNKKLGKRDGAKDILEYRDEGYLPDAMMNFLAFIGWNPGDEREILTPKEFIEAFKLEQIQRSGGGYNIEKLNWINREHIKRLTLKQQEENILKYFSDSIKSESEFSIERLNNLVPLILERIEKFSDVKTMADSGELDYFFEFPKLDISKINFKETSPSETKKHLESVVRVFDVISKENWNNDSIKSAVMAYADTLTKRGEALHPLRYSLSGAEHSPDPFTIASIIGKEETLSRINHAVSLL
jgi:glutamyl-tRNA synthetase